jgi:hypothetical protein
MSLAVLADHMASKGRGPDSMLIHMSPREVQGLQALAENHGGSLTINPETGLPEAGFLDKLLPAIIGVGISYFSGGTIDPKTAGMIVGGIETARTGDIGKGIQAGLGAYGGATLGSGFTTTGTEAIGSGAAADAYAGLGAAGITDAQAIAQGFGSAEELMQTKAALASQEAAAAATPFDKLSAGASKAADNPMKYLKANAMPLLYAAGPAILAGESAESNMPKTTTGMIRPYSFDPYSGTYTAATPYRAAEGGLMGMAAGGMAGYGDGDDVPRQNGMAQGGMYDFAQRSEPVVRMAEGGVPGYAGNDGSLVGGYKPTDTEIFNYFKTPGLSDAKIAQDMATFGVSAADIARATGTQNQQGDYEKRFVNTLVAPGTDASEFLAATKAVGLQGQGLTTAMQNAGLSQGAQYALTHAMDDKGYTGGVVDANTGKAVDLYNQLGYTAGALPGDKGGLEGLYANINYTASGLQNLINTGKMSVADAQNAALAELGRTNVSLKDVETATGKKFGNLFTPKTEVKKQGVVTCGPGFVLSADGLSCVPETVAKVTTPTNIATAGSTALPVGVSGAGTTTVNPNGTITTRPDLSLGMKTVRDDYVRGGGSLGYTPYTPQTIEEFDTKYGSRLTGGSKQSLDYLTGKTKYSPVPYTETGEIMKPYASSVLGIPMASSNKMYLFDPATKTYKINPDYAIPTYDKEGKKSLALTNQDVINYVKSPEYSNDDTFVSWMTANNLTPEQVAAATGMPISEVYKKIKKAKPVETVVDTPVTGQNDGGGGGEANGGLMSMARGGMAQQFNLGDYSDGGRLLRGPGDGVSDSIPASIGGKRPARLADGEFVVPARIVSELGNGSTEAGARKLYAMMDRIQSARRGTVGKGRVAKNSRSEKYLPA